MSLFRTQVVGNCRERPKMRSRSATLDAMLTQLLDDFAMYFCVHICSSWLSMLLAVLLSFKPATGARSCHCHPLPPRSPHHVAPPSRLRGTHICLSHRTPGSRDHSP